MMLGPIKILGTLLLIGFWATIFNSCSIYRKPAKTIETNKIEITQSCSLTVNTFIELNYGADYQLNKILDYNGHPGFLSHGIYLQFNNGNNESIRIRVNNGCDFDTTNLEVEYFDGLSEFSETFYFFGSCKYNNKVPDSVYLKHRNKDSVIDFRQIQNPDSTQNFRINISFYGHKIEVDSNNHSDIKKIVQHLQKHPDQKYIVANHTSNAEPKNQNLQLSYCRAKSLVNHLEKMGVNPGILYPNGFGDKYPIANNSYASGRNTNKRIEFIKIGKWEPKVID